MDKEKGHGILATVFFKTTLGFIIMVSAARQREGRFLAEVVRLTAIKLLLNVQNQTQWITFHPDSTPNKICHHFHTERVMVVVEPT